VRVKSHANLWPRVTSFENLYDAFRAARKGKRGRPDVAAFEFSLESKLLALQRELLDGTYRPGGDRHFVVREPVERKISAAPFRDRVGHHALCRVIEPLCVGNLLRRLVLPAVIQDWSLTSLQPRLFKTGGRLVRHARYFTLQLAEHDLTRTLFRQIVARLERLVWHPT